MSFHTAEPPAAWVLMSAHTGMCTCSGGVERKTLEYPWALVPHLSGPVLHPILILPRTRIPHTGTSKGSLGSLTKAGRMWGQPGLEGQEGSLSRDNRWKGRRNWE